MRAPAFTPSIRRSHVGWSFWIACVPLLGAAAQVELRGNVPSPDGEVLRVDADGVTFATAVKSGKSSAAPVVLSWDRVRTVAGPLAPQAAIFAPVSTQAWRARSRLARGDAVGAEPLYDALFTAYSRRSGATSASIAQGLTTCRLGRGAQSSAVAPWLVWLRAAASDHPALVADADAPINGSDLDPSRRLFTPDLAMGLIPSLPPIWIDLPATRALARATSAIEPLDEGIAATPASSKAEQLGLLYLIAARHACALDTPEIPPATDDAGVKLVADVVLATVGSAEQRDLARVSLRARIRSKPQPWVEAWARVALGQSLISEESADSKRLGIIELLHVPSRLPHEVPYLTGIALAQASVALHAFGDDAGADRLRQELATDFAGHPAMDWTPLRGWKPTVPLPSTAPPHTGSEQPTHTSPGSTAPRSGGS